MTEEVELADQNLKKKVKSAIINMLHMFKEVKENITMMWRKMGDRNTPKSTMKEKNPTCEIKIQCMRFIED